MGTPTGPFLKTVWTDDGNIAVKPVIWHKYHLTNLDDYIRELQDFCLYAEECNSRFRKARRSPENEKK
jgi:hypothetical protein